MLASILLFAFIVYLPGLGVVQLATGRYRLNFETHVMCTGVGLGTLALVTVVFGVFHIPLLWLYYAGAALGLFVLGSLRHILSKEVSDPAKMREEFWPRDTWHLVAAIGLAAALFAVYLHGAFLSPWLTDDDSWRHAVAAKYVARNLTSAVDVSVRSRVDVYLEPYPVTYPVLMGVLHQAQQIVAHKGEIPPGSISWTLKFFNALIVSLGIVYFYMLMKQWTSKPVAALWMTGVLWTLPCFMSHFVWAQSLSLVLFFPAFWAMERARGEPRWNLVAAVVVAGICLTQPSSAFNFVLMAAMYWVVNLVTARRGGAGSFTMREVVWQAGGLLFGGLASLLFYVPTFLKFGYEQFLLGVAHTDRIVPKLSGIGVGVFYGITDFIWAPASTHINQPTGIGLVLFFLLVAALTVYVVRRRETLSSRLRVTALVWLVFTVLGTVANYLPVSLFPHRFWAFFAIPVAIITGDALAWATEQAKGRTVVTALATGATLGGAIALFGVGEAMYGLAWAPLEGVRLLAAILLMLAGLVAATIGLDALRLESVSTREWVVFLGLSAVMAGVALTSGFAKTLFEGFAQWEPGSSFYQGLVKAPGSDVPSYESSELWAYVGLRSSLAPNTPVLGLTCPESRIIGFDFYMPPLDVELGDLRAWVQSRPLEDLNEDVVKRIHQVAVGRRFELMTVDYHWAANPQRQRAQTVALIRQVMTDAKLTPGRVQDLLDGTMTATPLEEKDLADLRVLMRCQQDARRDEEDALRRIARLNDLLEKSDLFEKSGRSVDFALTLYKVKPPTGEGEKK